MPRPIASGICEAVKRDLENGERDLKTLMSKHGISGTKARSMKHRFLTTGEVINLDKKKGSGRKRKLSAEQIESLRLFLEDHPDAYLKEMCTFMEDLYGVRVNGSTMQRTCVRIGWKLKQQPRPRDDTGFWVRTLPRDDNGNAIRDGPRVKKRPADWGSKLSYTKRRALLEKTREWVEAYMSRPPFDTSHDYSHVKRVLAICFQILRVEQKEFRAKACDGLALELLALMHDVEDHKYHPKPAIGNGSSNSVPQSASTGTNSNTSSDITSSSIINPYQISPTQNDPGSQTNGDHPTSRLPTGYGSLVEVTLLQLGWPPHVTSKVAAMTPYVSYTAEKSNPEAFAAALSQHPEIAFVQDADRLDAIGATGIGRTFAYTGARGREGGLMATLDHFRTKLIELGSLMKTGEGRRLAASRTERLRTFGRWWLEEMCMIDQDHGDMAWVQEDRRTINSITNDQASSVTEVLNPTHLNAVHSDSTIRQPASSAEPLSVQLNQVANQG